MSGLLLFVDFKKAFDSVDRGKLLLKLMKDFMLPPYLVKLLQNYFQLTLIKLICENKAFYTLYIQNLNFFGSLKLF